MGMGMDHRVVTVAVSVPWHGLVPCVVPVVGVSVVVHVIVLDLGVGVRVLMIAAQHERHATQRKQQGDDLFGSHGVGEHRPRDDSAHERCGRKHELAARGPQREIGRAHV